MVRNPDMWRKVTPMPPEELQRWERLRRLGRKTYAYKYGVMYWELFVFSIERLPVAGQGRLWLARGQL